MRRGWQRRLVLGCLDSLRAEIGIDIGDFLKEEIKGPATFSCKTNDGCKFEEPAMNQLINDIFGDKYISLTCEGGECLHYSQVPGYVVCNRPISSGLFMNVLVAETTQTKQHTMDCIERRRSWSNCHFNFSRYAPHFSSSILIVTVS
jgi:hypothetical protein